MDSSYTRTSHEDGSTEFKVTPGDIKNTVGGMALAAIIGFFFAFSGGPDGVSWFQILFGAAIGYGSHRGIIWWRTRRANPGGAPRGGSFRADATGIVLPSGEKLARADIRDLVETNSSTDNATSYVLGADTTKGMYLLATGMDVGTALTLRREICDLLGIDQAPQ